MGSKSVLVSSEMAQGQRAISILGGRGGHPQRYSHCALYGQLQQWTYMPASSNFPKIEAP